MYPELMLIPMREELTRVGVQELRTAEEVDRALANQAGTTMVVVNSICGCAAGRMRPGVCRALQHSNRPENLFTVFAGQDTQATDRARSYFAGYRPSSPSIGLSRAAKLIYMIQRSATEYRDAEEFAAELTSAFDKF